MGSPARHWVARDDRGTWRAYGVYSGSESLSGRSLAEYLFHREEIGKVMITTKGDTRVEILES